MLGLEREEVKLIPYDENWKKEFEKEKIYLQKVLKDIAILIEHVGSTSIEGLSAKPILDIAVGVVDKEILYKTIDIMSRHGYQVKNSIEDRDEVLAIKGNGTNHTHYIHIMVASGDRCKNQILFRDYLRKHKETVKEYESLKKELAKIYKDERLNYTAGKNNFILSVLEEAKKEENF